MFATVTRQAEAAGFDVWLAKHGMQIVLVLMALTAFKIYVWWKRMMRATGTTSETPSAAREFFGPLMPKASTPPPTAETEAEAAEAAPAEEIETFAGIPLSMYDED